ncbi:aldehyde dehydrogenase family protein [Shewanella surugensis]|uniref:Aldehyde dehydrogenase family protein n=1 Tax=Shewanella surugensis TaxID=212020 RepID=A0ABT0LB49_9GAMM|nr:aldehyde dehydrogenase family protein [Shewanella surugensis]MCL1124936.1 aldehyde dehydrogenase family protein [Shewanella surugensis]
MSSKNQAINHKIQETISPIDSQVYVTRPLASKDDISEVVEQANMMQKSWATLPLADRKLVCVKAIDILMSQKKVLANELCWMMGRPIRYCEGELNGLDERAQYLLQVSDHALSPVVIAEKAGFTRYIKREALGVVLIIAPWNYPYLTAINSLIPALLTGNSVIIKHSAQTPLCAERLVSAFEAAGMPKGIVQFLHTSHENTLACITKEAIHHVAFTGSVLGGKKVEQAAAGRFLSVGLELGGKDPAYVRQDANIEKVAEILVQGAFFNSGQSCCAIERIYVHERVFDLFLATFVQWVLHYQLGRSDDSDTTLGPMISTFAADVVRAQIHEAIALGAVTHIDESLFPLSQAGTPYLAPQVLTQVDHRMRLMTEESFGPVIGIQKVKDDNEALCLMNDSEFGLTAAIFTQDIETGVALGDKVDTGTFFINRCDYLDPALAWTGVKQSGRGCSLSVLGFESVTRPKSYHIKHR